MNIAVPETIMLQAKNQGKPKKYRGEAL